MPAPTDMAMTHRKVNTYSFRSWLCSVGGAPYTRRRQRHLYYSYSTHMYSSRLGRRVHPVLTSLCCSAGVRSSRRASDLQKAAPRA